MAKEEPTDFWTKEYREQLIFAHRMLLEVVGTEKKSPILEEAYQHYRLLPKTLLEFGCGISPRETSDGQRWNWLLLPYQNGFNLVYIFDKEIIEKGATGKEVINLPVGPEVRPWDSFFGADAITGAGSRCFVCEDPITAMLLYQAYSQYNDDDVLSFIRFSPDQPTRQQKEWLNEQISENGWDKIYLLRKSEEHSTVNNLIVDNVIDKGWDSAPEWFVVDAEGDYNNFTEMLKEPVTVDYLEGLLAHAEVIGSRSSE